MSTQAKRDPLVLFFHTPKFVRRRKDTQLSTEALSGLLQHLVKLRRDGTLDDDDFTKLVRLASTAFIEAELTNKVDSILRNSSVGEHLNKSLDELLLGTWK